MHVRILNSSMIVDFLNVGFDATEISSIVRSEANKLANQINIKVLKDWEVHFIFSYTNGKQILISTKSKSIPKEKYKEIVTHIPIPTKNKISWGVELEQHVYKNEDYLDYLLKNFYCLDVDFSKFNNRHDYILDGMRRVVAFSFKNGFTVKGVKIKI